MIIQNPDKVQIDMDDPAVMYGVAGALAARATPETFEKILRFADQMPQEYQTILIRDSMQKEQDLRHEQCFKNWTKANANALL